MIFFTELWLTDDDALLPDLDEADLSGFREMAAADADAMVGLEQALAQDPRLEVAFDRSRAQLEELEGTPVESTVFWVALAEGETFDPELALADAEGDLGGDLASAAASGAREAAGQALRRGLGRLGFGNRGGDEEEEEEAAEAPSQMTFLRVITRIEDVQRTGVPASTFEVPSDYREASIGGATGGR
jgi:hypothetical protein